MDDEIDPLGRNDSRVCIAEFILEIRGRCQRIVSLWSIKPHPIRPYQKVAQDPGLALAIRSSFRSELRPDCTDDVVGLEQLELRPGGPDSPGVRIESATMAATTRPNAPISEVRTDTEGEGAPDACGGGRLRGVPDSQRRNGRNAKNEGDRLHFLPW